LNKLLRWVLIGLFVLAALFGAALALADSDWGHRQIVAKLATIQPQSGLRIRIGRIDGSIYGRAKVRDLQLSDPKGVFFAAPVAEIHWSPFAYLSNRLEITRLTAPTATLYRLPKLRPSLQKRPILPSFDIALGWFEIASLQIEPGVAGERRIGRISGSLVTRAQRALIDVIADAALGDKLTFKLDSEPDRGKFDLEAMLRAPSGGVFGAILGTAKPVAIDVTGKGGWTSWQGLARAQMSGLPVADLGLTAEKGQFGLNGSLFLESLTQGKLQRLVGPVTRVRGNSSLHDRRLDGEITLSSAALGVRAHGVVDLAVNQFRNMLIDAQLNQPPALFPNMTGQNIALKARLDGEFQRASFDYLLTAPRVAFDQTGFDQVRASGQGRFSPSPIAVPIKLSAARVTGVGDVAGGILANLSVDGTLLVTSSTITGDGLKLVSDKLSGKLALFVDLKTGVYDIGLAGELTRYLIPGLGIVDVKSELKVVPGSAGRGSQIRGHGEAWVRRFDNSFLASLAGGLPHLQTDLSRGPDGLLYLTNLKLMAPKLVLVGKGLRRRDGTFQFEGSGKQSQYGPLRLTFDGPIDRPKLDVFLERPADALGLANVRLLLDPNLAGYGWRADGQSTLGRFSGTGQLLLPKGSAAAIEIVDLSTSGMKARGRLQAVAGGFTGRLSLSGGGVEGNLDLSPVNGAQKIEAHLKARDARFEGPPLFAVRRGSFDGTIILADSGTNVEGTISAQGLARGSLSLARLAANIRLRDGVGEIKAAFAGSRGRAFDVQTVAQVTGNRWQVIGSGTIERKPVSLSNPAILTREGSGWRLAPTELSFSGGRARLSGLFGDAANDLEASLVQMPLSILDILSPGLGLGGIANGTISYRQPNGGQPNGNANLKIRGLTRSGLILSSQPIDMGVAANYASGIAGIRAIAISGGREIGRGQARLQPGTNGNLMQRFANAPLFGQIRYSGSADALWRLSGVEALDVSGPIALGADVSGRVSDPVIRGSLKAMGARIESPTTGMVLTNVNASARFGEGSKLILDSLSGNSGKDGRVSGRGMIDLASERGFSMKLDLQAEQASLLARDDLAATVTGPIQITSDGVEGVVAGEVTLNRSRFRLGQAEAAQTLPRLNIREINGRVDEALPPRRAMPWRLAIRARAPNRVTVTGLGLQSEWRADLDIGGTPFAPVIRGRADLIRGDYEFAGRRFELSRGSIRFQGENPPDPILDILAVGDTQGISAKISVTGTGQRPEIRFASTPSLPEDELLSRLLFGTSITNLSAPEAVQLAAAVASLRNGGNGLNPINALRNAIGLDRLRILPADTTTGQRTAVAAGKYLSRRAYVEIITDGQGYSATRAEFIVTRWLSILSSISTIGRSTVSARISKDY
jgi:translocation and assembly module TamB